MSTDTPSTTTFTVSQQALNVLYQMINAKGWPDTLAEAYIGGKLTDKYLPPLDSLTWLRSNEDLAKMTPDELKQYQEMDKAWGAKQVTLNLTEKQVGVVKHAFTFFIGELIKAKGLGPNRVFNEIIDAFSIQVEGLE